MNTFINLIKKSQINMKHPMAFAFYLIFLTVVKGLIQENNKSFVNLIGNTIRISHCPPGYYYNITNNTSTTMSGNLNCSCSPAGSYSNQNSTGYTQCPPGSSSDSCSSFCTPRCSVYTYLFCFNLIFNI